ncbi:MAG TPA: OB-fold nucleic acid binding domain-containing protein [Terriglobales bacterium]|nr:OB-fold nucleic acid binding domain-containing protein [Terriglobales bacterium]
MKDFYICDCSRVENQTITSFFVVAVKQVKSKKSGELYLSLMLADRSGQIQANMWDNVNDAISAFDQDDFVKAKGVIHKYNGRWQLTIHKMRKLGEAEIDYADYLPKTSKNVEELWQTVCNYVDSFENPWLKSLLKEFIADEAIVSAYKTAPAAKSLHHAFVGGLLDHVVSLFNMCDLAVRNYPQVNRDLLLSGAFLHDIGKLHELAYQRSISYTTKGQLLGHMIIELGMLGEKIQRVPGFPDELRVLLEHMIISHHGQYEFGSPKLPMFPEALMLHYLDDLDSKMESMRAQFEREADLDTAWTSYNPSLARPLLNTRKFLEKGLRESRLVEPPKPVVTPAAEAAGSAAEPAEAAEPATHAPAEIAAADSGDDAAPTDQAPLPDPEKSEASGFAALQRKFESHKVTAVGDKTH